MTKEAKEAIIELLAREMQVPVDGIKLDTKLSELGIDSLKAIVILSELEDLFKIEIPNEAMESIVTVGDVVAQVDAFRQKPS